MPWKSPFITRWVGFRNRNRPTVFAEQGEIYARLASAMEQVTSARGFPGTDSRREVRQQKIDLNYSTTSCISRAGPALKMLIVCITQVPNRAAGHRSVCLDSVGCSPPPPLPDGRKP